jgi:hypothetical protein
MPSRANRMIRASTAAAAGFTAGGPAGVTTRSHPSIELAGSSGSDGGGWERRPWLSPRAGAARAGASASIGRVRRLAIAPEIVRLATPGITPAITPAITPDRARICERSTLPPEQHERESHDAHVEDAAPTSELHQAAPDSLERWEQRTRLQPCGLDAQRPSREPRGSSRERGQRTSTRASSSEGPCRVS